MKPLIVNTFDQYSGSALAAWRLHQGLQASGIASQMLVYKKYSNHPAVLGPQSQLEDTAAKLWRTVDRLGLQLYQQLTASAIGDEFSVPWLPDRVKPRIDLLQPDLINLHWVNYGYMQIETLARLGKPIVWTLHDMWPFTGGCHYSQGCDRYQQHCGSCPQLHSRREADLSAWIWQRKARAWQNLNLTIVTPSHWLAACARASSLLQHCRIEVIPNGLDPAVYRPFDRAVVRTQLGLPLTKRLILFGAINPTAQRKGFHLLQAALKHLSQTGWQDQAELVIFGADAADQPLDLGFKTHYLGQLQNDRALAQAYAAADVFVCPSLQENLPNTVVEAIACGTPAVGFAIGGIPEIIEPQRHGYLAQPGDVADFARGIAWVIEQPDRHQQLCRQARQRAEAAFTQTLQAQRYLRLFSELLTDRDQSLATRQPLSLPLTQARGEA